MKRIKPITKNIAAFLLTICLTQAAFTDTVFAAPHTESTVTAEMCTAAYWNARSGELASAILMTPEHIDQFNASALVSEGCNMNDLTKIDKSYDATELKASLSASTISEMPQKPIYVNSLPVDTATYYAGIAESINASTWDGTLKPFYALSVKQTQIKSIPTPDYIGYSEGDTDDEVVLSSLKVNDPFLVEQCAFVGGHVYYWGYSDNVSGWVDAMDIAFCQNKSEWLGMWQNDTTGTDFIVVTTDYFHLSKSHYSPSTSDLLLTMGTTLKLVPEKDLPTSIWGRGTWNNYAVYVPTRDADGNCVKQIALIAQNKDVNIGYLPMTSENVLNLSFEYLGDTYGWGGMLDSVDCSALVRNVYRCFGLNMPRNTNWQKYVPGTCVDISGLDDLQKAEAISACYPGTPLYMPGHTMIYLGTIDGVNYVISALGSASDSSGELNIVSQNTVAVTPLTVRRRNGTTWLANINSYVMPILFKNN